MSIYGFVWRHLPGPRLAKAFIALVLAAAIVATLFTWVFPSIAPLMPFNDITVGS
jgi:hypothetical protein